MSALEVVSLSASERRRVLWSFIKLIWRASPMLFIVRTFILLGGAISSALQVYFFARLISAITSHASDQALPLVVAAIASYGALRLFDALQSSAFEDYFQRNIGHFAHSEVVHRLAAIDPSRLDEEGLRRSLDVVRQELWRINNLPFHIERIVRGVFQLASVVSLAFLTPWWVALLALSDSFVQAIKSLKESKRDIWDSTWNSLDGRRVEYTNHTFMTPEELRELRLLGATAVFLKRFHQAGTRIIERFKRTAERSVLLNVIATFYHIGVYAAVLWIFGIGSFKDAALLSSLYISINLFQLFGQSLNTVTASWGRLQSSVSILARIDDLMRYPTESTHGLNIPEASLTIEFQNVSFRYPHAHKDAITNLNVTINEHEHLAVVGENGAGKSTFLRLLSGLDAPTSGQILVNGKPLQKYKREEWRRAFHLMLQGAKLYQDVISQSLRYGEPSKAWRAFSLPTKNSLRVSGADSVIAELPKGLDTFLGDWAAPPGEDPRQVSGGQQQRLLIARTLIHGGRLIGFDEPTSAMDAVAETAFFERLHDQMNDRGLIYISHRFSTVRRASRILVFEHGQLVQDGTHEALVSKKGSYAKLYQEQAKWYAKE